jgi:hypothetical protein
MAPILGIFDSAKSGNLYSASFESIATVTVGAGGSSEIEFASISSSYTHLQLRCSALTSTSGKVMVLRFNSDTGGNYTWHYLNGDGTSASAGNATGNGFARFFGQNVGTNTANPTAAFVDILDYTNTNKYTTIRALAGCDNNGSGEVSLQSSLWLNTAAITNIKIRTNDGSNYAQYSSFALYGIKVA